MVPPAPNPIPTAVRSRQSIAASQDVRRHNLATVLWHVHVAGALRRAELTGRLGLNRSTIAALVAELVTLGLVREERHEGRPQPWAGRPSPTVHACTESVQVLAADVGVRRASIALVGLGGRVLARHSGEIADPTPAAVADLATLPGRPELYSKLLFLMQAPMQQLVTVLSATPRNLVTVLNEAAKKKGEQAG